MLRKESLKAYASAQRSAFETRLRQIVEISSVSSEPDRKQDVRRAAEAGAGIIREFGGEARVVETDGHPIVFGKIRSGNDSPVDEKRTATDGASRLQIRDTGGGDSGHVFHG